MNQGSCSLVVEIAKQYEQPGGLSLDRLVAAGEIGLREAVKRFDPERGENLSVSASRWIHRSIKKALTLNRAPTAKEISAIYAKRSALPPTHKIASFLLPSFDLDTRNSFRAVLIEGGLDKREQEIISLRYGMADGVPKTHKQIGNALGLTRSRISQIERIARAKLENLP
jgi:RNA polymerase sporulation-specific sigma factor